MPFTIQDRCMLVNQAQPVAAEVRVPGSKSLTNRYLLLAGLAEGESTLINPLDSDDTLFMRRALGFLGCCINEEDDDSWTIRAPTHWSPPGKTLFAGNAGTVMRFLTPALATQPLNASITGNVHMLKRPMQDLVDGLRALGGGVDYMGEQGYPPLALNEPITAGEVAIRGDASSQYLSGMLMALPLLQGDSSITVTTPLVSSTYVEMTLACMADMGVSVDHDASLRSFNIKGGQRYRGQNILVEPDASTASYWFALPLILGGTVQVNDMPEHSQQGDFGLLDIFEQMGAQIEHKDKTTRVTARGKLKAVAVDMNTRSDVAPTLAVVATFADGPTTIYNVGNMRIKECDRINCMQAAFDALGLHMESGKDWIQIYPGKPTRPAELDPQSDHRMAIIFSLLGLAFGGVTLKQPHCVAKTYPSFFQEFGDALKVK